MPDQFVTMLTDIAKAAEEASPMRASSLIRRRGDQRRNRQRAAVGTLSVLAVGAIVATGSFLGMHHTANNLPATPPSTTTSPPATVSPTVTASSPSTISPTTSATEASAPPATATQLSVAITGLPPATTLAIGGKEIEFTVTVTNPTAQTFRNIAPNVSTGHCSCSDGPLRLAPDGTLKWRQADGSWKTIQYVHQAGGMDYINAKQAPGFTLEPGATASFTFRMGFTATQQAPYRNGQTSVDVTMVGLAGYTAVGPVTKEASPDTPGAYAMAILGSNPAASTPIRVTTN